MGPLPLHGIIPPLVTPLRTPWSLDGPSLERIIEHVIGGGVNGIFLLGSTGEGPCLTEKIKKAVIRESIRTVSDRVPVLINISAASFLETIHMAEYAAREGADFVVLSPPFYFEMNNHELLRYYRSVADHSPVPLLIYNAPRYTKTSIEPEIIRELRAHQNILGLKDSSGNMDYIRDVVNERGNDSFPILIGPEMLLGQSLLIGCNGGVCGGANLYPNLYVNYYQAALENNIAVLDRTQEIFRLIQSNLYEVAHSPMGIVIGLKYLLWKRGLCSYQMAMPVYEKLSTDQKVIMETLDNKIMQL